MTQSIRNVDRGPFEMEITIDPSLLAEWALFVRWRPAYSGDVAGFQLFTTIHDTGKPELAK